MAQKRRHIQIVRRRQTGRVDDVQAMISRLVKGDKLMVAVDEQDSDAMQSAGGRVGAMFSSYSRAPHAGGSRRHDIPKKVGDLMDVNWTADRRMAGLQDVKEGPLRREGWFRQ